MNTVVVVGGAGYIGSHTCKALAADGFAPVVFDDLSTGHADFVRWGPLVQGDIHDTDALTALLDRWRPVAVVHFAARAYVRQSMADPLTYYQANVAGTLSLLRAMRASGASRRLVFSSTCAVFAESGGVPVDETMPLVPLSPYGHSKAMVERILADQASCGAMESVVLRYFNAAGADLDGDLGERHHPETHLIPLAIAAAVTGAPLPILGDDFPTPDGTAIRDYVHVADLARAHVLAVRHLLAGLGSDTFNLGSGRATSVLDVLAGLGRLGLTVPVQVHPRAPGDAARMVADPAKASRVLEWFPRHSDLDTILDSAVRWHRASWIRR